VFLCVSSAPRPSVKATFPSYEVLGWYTTASSIDPVHGAVHKQMKTLNERPLFMLVDSKVDPKARDLPCTVFSEVVHVGEKISTEFVPSAYRIESEEVTTRSSHALIRCLNAR
jgi:COP9 signalosome complex subunit 6